MSPATTFSLVYASAAAVALIAFAVVWRRREAAGGTSLALMLLAAAFWALCDAVELHAATAGGRQLVSQIQYVGVVAVAPLFLHTAVGLAGVAHGLTWPVLAGVWAVPVVSLGLVWTNPWHQWIWTEISTPADTAPFALYRYGWWFWVLTAQHYLLMVAASVVLLGAMRRVGRHFRPAMMAVLVAVALPWLGNAAYNLKLGPWPGLNWLTLALAVSGPLLAWVVLREGLLDLLPHAREALLDMMTDAVVVIDARGRLMFANGAARRLLDVRAEALAALLGVDSLLNAPEHWRSDVAFESRGSGRWLDLRLGPLRDRWGRLAGRLIVGRDVTAQKLLEAERERLIGQLREAVQTVTQLEGLLSICSTCRKVRDDAGHWQQFEVYIRSRAPVEFSHGICPECLERYYSDFTVRPQPDSR